MKITLNYTSFKSICKTVSHELNIILIDKLNKVDFVEFDEICNYITSNFDLNNNTQIEYNNLFNDIRKHLNL